MTVGEVFISGKSCKMYKNKVKGLQRLFSKTTQRARLESLLGQSVLTPVVLTIYQQNEKNKYCSPSDALLPQIVTDTCTWFPAELFLRMCLTAPSQKSPGGGPTAFPSPAKSKWSTRTACWRFPAFSRTTRAVTSAWPRTRWGRTQSPVGWLFMVLRLLFEFWDDATDNWVRQNG